MANLKIVPLSDTHNLHSKLKVPECDVLIHCGDFSGRGRKDEVIEFAKWLNLQEAAHIIVVPGNHEVYFEKALPESRNWILEHCPAAHILIDQTVEIEGVKFHGSPYTPWFHHWAFNRARNPNEGLHYEIPLIKPHWDMIPDDVNVLITHGPPYGILDEVFGVTGDSLNPPRIVGCEDLLRRIDHLTKLKYHFFGHIHSSYGEKHINGKSFYNVANCSETYRIENEPIIIDYEED